MLEFVIRLLYIAVRLRIAMLRGFGRMRGGLTCSFVGLASVWLLFFWFILIIRSSRVRSCPFRKVRGLIDIEEEGRDDIEKNMDSLIRPVSKLEE